VVTASAQLMVVLDATIAVTGTGGFAALVYGLSKAATSPNGVSPCGDAKVGAALAASLLALALTIVAIRVGRTGLAGARF